MSNTVYRSVLALGLALAAQAGHAADLTVTSLADAGAGSLREAIATANATPGADRIVFQQAGLVMLGSGALRITGSVEIVGCAGCGVRAQGGSRVFELAGDPNEPAALAVTLRRLELSAGASAQHGGALLAEYATVRIEDCLVRDTIAAGWGGALYLDASDVTIARTRFTGNGADGFGGAIASNVGALRIQRSSFDANRAESGGGAIWANWAQGASLVVEDSTFDRNSAAFDGGAIEAHVPSLSISGSTFVANAADYWAGGALYVGEEGTAAHDIVNSTFFGNRATQDGGQGAAILLESGRLRLRHVTVAANVVGVDESGSQGGAIEVGADFESQLEIVNSIIADNITADGAPADLVRRHDPLVPNRLDVRHTLIGSAPAPGTINGQASANLVAVAPGFDTFGWNGGPTATLSLRIDSAACDTGEATPSLANDQRGRGFARAWGRPDLGAYEVHGDSIFRDGFEREAQPVGCRR